jgi:hypothetical protein
MVRFGRPRPLSGPRGTNAVWVRDVLAEQSRASTDVGARALRGTPGASAARAAAVGSMIVDSASRILDEELSTSLLRGLLRAVELREALMYAARRSREEPSAPVWVELGALHTVEAESSAEFSVLVDHVVRVVGTASATVTFGAADLRAQVWNGSVTGFDAQQSVTATLALDELRIDGQQVLLQPCTLAEGKRGTNWGTAPLPRPIPLEVHA